MRIFFSLFISILIFSSVISPASSNERRLRVLMVINEGFWAPEYYRPRALFDQEGYEVIVAAKSKSFISPDTRNKDYKPVKADISFEQVNISDFDAISFAGGNGAWTDYFPDEKVHRIVSEAFAKNKTIGFLCASTGLLGIVNNFDGLSSPIAKGRHVTGYFRVEGILRQLGQVNYDPGEPGKPYVVRDGNLITGRDPISSELFGQEMVKLINSSSKN